MSIQERLKALREQMKEKKIDIYIVPTADFHQTEYVGEYFKARKYITNFSGSAGTAVITADEARLWTDGRYFIQAAEQIAGTTVELMKMGEPGVPTIKEYLADTLKAGGNIGFDGRAVAMSEGLAYEEIAKEKNGRVIYACSSFCRTGVDTGREVCRRDGGRQAVQNPGIHEGKRSVGTRSDYA